MSITKLKMINFTAEVDQLDGVLERFIKLEDFHPVEANKIIGRVHGLTSVTSDNPCTPILNEITNIEKELGLDIPPTHTEGITYTYDEMRDYVDSNFGILKKFRVDLNQLEENIHKNQDALRQVLNIESLDISLDDIFSCEYVYARVGRLPIESVEKLKYYRSRPFIFQSFSEDKNYSWCMYFTTNEYEREVDNIFSSLFFERIYIPEFVHGTPGKAKENMQAEIDEDTRKKEQIQKEMEKFYSDYRVHLGEIKGQLLEANRKFEAKKYVIGMGTRFSIQGFVEESKIAYVKEQFKDIPELEVEVRPARSDHRIMPPTKLKNSWFSKPFAMFVEMYGLPRYGDLDPTPFVAITYTLLFGIMFADLGQGLALALFGWLMYRWKKMRLGQIGIRVGISAAIFGLLEGSLFGNEEILLHFYTDVLGWADKPFHVMSSEFTMTLLMFALFVGAALIMISMLLNIFRSWKNHNIAEMLFSHNGLAGFLFYSFILTSASLMLVGGPNLFNPFLLILFMGIPLILIFLKEPLHRVLHHEPMFPDGFGGFFTEAFFELFEILLSYITNTMSFLRVGGFVLSHAGMMLVVSSIMAMVGNASLVVAILGNIFVMGLEGLIVGIQVLRLEFYEMFSRYYEGDGIAFQSI